jgi:hypothetical protein
MRACVPALLAALVLGGRALAGAAPAQPSPPATELTPATLLLLDSPDQGARRAAVIGLLHQNAATPETRARLAGLLREAMQGFAAAGGEGSFLVVWSEPRGVDDVKVAAKIVK